MADSLPTTSLDLSQDELKLLIGALNLAFLSGKLTLGDGVALVPLALKIDNSVIKDAPKEEVKPNNAVKTS